MRKSKKIKENNETSIYQPHDKFFRTIMADKRVAQAFLRAHLPLDILKVIDLENIELQPRSYINDIKKESAVDVLFKTTLNDEEAYLYLLVEHQSKPDKLMAFRVLKYIVNIMDSHIKKGNKKPLPLIYPMVVYHAEKPYLYSTDIKDLINAPQELIERYFLKPFNLIDLGKIDDEEIKKHSWASILEFALKHVFERDVLPWVKNITATMQRIVQEGGEKYVEIVLEYIVENADVSSKNEFIDLINNEISKNIGEKIMSLADRIKAEGRQEGRQEGIQEGRQEGIQKGRQEGIQEGARVIALKLIKKGEKLETVAMLTDLNLDELKKIKEKISH